MLHSRTSCTQELELIPEDSSVYKLVGPVLIKQDQFEAKSNVQKRLDFIASEMTNLDSQMKTIDDKRNRKQQQESLLLLVQATEVCCHGLNHEWHADYEDAAGIGAITTAGCLA